VGQQIVDDLLDSQWVEVARDSTLNIDLKRTSAA